MWRRVDLVWTDVSEESIASILSLEKIRERGTSASKWLQTEPPVDWWQTSVACSAVYARDKKSVITFETCWIFVIMHISTVVLDGY
jgi:hypothetical protein